MQLWQKAEKVTWNGGEPYSYAEALSRGLTF